MLCTNTMHKVADAITAAVDVPFVHIADTTADAVRRPGLATVGLLATAYTMEQDFYVGRLRDMHGLDVLVPDEADRRIVHRVIYEELCVGVVDDGSRDEYRRVMRDLAGARRRGHPARVHGDRPARRPADSPVPSSTPPGFTRSAPSSSPSQATGDRAHGALRRQGSATATAASPGASVAGSSAL